MINFKKNTATKTALETLQTRSANAVSLIRSTIEQLRATNDAIDAEHNNNDSAIAQLTATNNSLDTLKADNIKIIANFESLLS